ncbi:UDP-N-acetylglucosamine 2-epimerase [Lacrimispora sp.]|uniref:UDP-N-acetylglucosamine 2-epimerase n=1 Tax=Lacrimispora sp. TaxID=2719234 RepID=UPI0028A99E67|nr:UDP-N-acetylglucosamine 2-epimerase [Lacrimispora sp.]
MIRLCVVTGSRAEYGLLLPVIRRVMADPDFKLLLVVTGAHMDYRLGADYREMEQDGVTIDETVEMNLASDSSYGICQSMGLELIGISKAYERLKPDMILLLGDRYEIFIAASAASICNIPIAHIHGGELTRGAYDDCMRHSITKMSYLHFTSTMEYRKRVIQLGESPDRVFHVGALGVERLKKLSLLSRKELEESLNLSLGSLLALVTYHPATLESADIEEQVEPLLKVLDSLPELFAVFTGSNSDTGGSKVNEMVADYAKLNPHRAAFYSSLGSLRYLSLMSQCSMVIGNSSSGIIEAPSLKVPTVNIGTRQKGRIMADSVINCDTSYDSILSAILKARDFNWKDCSTLNPYDSPDTSKKILGFIKQAVQSGICLEKDFYDIDWS